MTFSVQYDLFRSIFRFQRVFKLSCCSFTIIGFFFFFFQGGINSGSLPFARVLRADIVANKVGTT